MRMITKKKCFVEAKLVMIDYTFQKFLSIRTGSPLLACPVLTTEEGWLCRISEPLRIEATGKTRSDVIALTRLLAQHFERAIAAKPVDWHMFQPAWP